MPSLEQNRIEWGHRYDWPSDGEEWSGLWGGAETHWHAAILPRIRRFVPAGTILEIAPGYGRWSKYLIANCERFVGVDLNENCVEACSKRFADASHAAFVANNGSSLEAVDDRSVDFAFSFDSLVHVEADVIAAYLHELNAKLSDDGVAFLHHSNLGEYGTLVKIADRTRFMNKVPPVYRALGDRGFVSWEHWRARSVSAQVFRETCDAAGLVCIGQEIVNWSVVTSRRRPLIDCLSLVVRPGSRWYRQPVIIRNPLFMAEAKSAGALAQVWNP